MTGVPLSRVIVPNWRGRYGGVLARTSEAGVKPTAEWRFPGLPAEVGGALAPAGAKTGVYLIPEPIGPKAR